MVKKSLYSLDTYDKITDNSTGKELTFNKNTELRVNGKSVPLIYNPPTPSTTYNRSKYLEILCGNHPIFGKITKPLVRIIKEEITDFEIFTPGLSYLQDIYSKPPIIFLDNEVIQPKGSKILYKDVEYTILLDHLATRWENFYYIEVPNNLNIAIRHLLTTLIDNETITYIPCEVKSIDLQTQLLGKSQSLPSLPLLSSSNSLIGYS